LWRSPSSPHGRSTLNGYNFTDRVRAVLKMAREEAARLRHHNVGTEHILLGLIREGEGIAAAVLSNLGVDLEEIWETIEEKVTKGTADRAAGPDLPYTSRAKKALELAMRESREMNHSYVGTEHLLLGLLCEKDGIAAQVLTDVGVTLQQARVETLRLMPQGTESPRSRTDELSRREEILGRMRELVGQLLATPAPDAGRLGGIATELNYLLDELDRIG
jgi:ATP-dependent Clp protease ATP-binding subunit ClpC